MFSSGAFAETPVGQTGLATVTVTNSGSAGLTPSGLVVNGAGVAITGGTCGVSVIIAAGASCTVTLSWSPIVGGALSGGSLTISYPDGANPSDTLTLTGSALEAPGAPPAPVAVAGDGQVTVIVSAPSSGGTVVSFTATASPGGAQCVLIGSSGSCEIVGLTNGTPYTVSATAANAAGTSPASPSSTSVTPKGMQSITFIQPADTTLDAGSFTATPTSSSGLAVTLISTTPTVCAVSGFTIILIGTGTCALTGQQIGDIAWNPAPDESRSLQINHGVPLIPTFGVPTPTVDGYTVNILNYDAAWVWAGAATGGGAVSLGTPNSATLPITITNLAGNTTATLTVTTTRAGYTTGTAMVTGTSLQAQVIDFPGLVDTAFTDSPPIPAAVASSGLSVVYSSAAAGVCSVTGVGVVTFVSAGVCLIDVDQPGDFNYAPASRVQQAFNVTLGAALTPTFGVPTPTVDGYTVNILNYDAAWVWAGAATGGGAVSLGTPNSATLPITITNLAGNTTATLTVTTTRAGYTTGTAMVTGTGLQAGNISLAFLDPPKRIVSGQPVTLKLLLTTKPNTPTPTPASTRTVTTGINGTVTITVNNTPACTATIKNGKGSCTAKITDTGEIILTGTFNGTAAGVTSTATATVRAITGTVSISKATLKIKQCQVVLTLTGYSTKPGTNITIWTKTRIGKTKLGTAKTRRNGTWKYITTINTLQTKIQVADKKTKTPWQTTTTQTTTRGC